MFGRLTGVIDRVIQAYLPDPLVIVLLLTVFIFVLGIATGGSTPTEIMVYFGDRFGGLLEFAMRMRLGLAIVAMAASWVNCGFGLVIGAFFARRLAREVPGVDYRVLISSACSGFLIWHSGLSGSVPLTAATPGNFLGAEVRLVPTS